MKANLRKKGFTLMEMLIVVAVIAILVAIAIPVFSAQLEKSREAVCTANRRSLLSVVYASAMTADKQEGDVSDTALQAAYKKAFTDDAAAQKNYVCPSGGTYSWANGHVECSAHGAAGGAGVTIGGKPYALTAAVTELKTGESFASALKKGDVVKIDGVYYVLTDARTPNTAESLLAYAPNSVARAVNVSDAPLTSAASSSTAEPIGTLYKDDDGKLYVKLSGAYCTNLPSGASNNFWALIGEAA